MMNIDVNTSETQILNPSFDQTLTSYKPSVWSYWIQLNHSLFLNKSLAKETEISTFSL